MNLTDNEIIKALNDRMYCGKWIGKGFLDKKDFKILKDALDLINRQKAENESDRAKIEIAAECIARQDKEIKNLRHNNRQLVNEKLQIIEAIKQLKAEAVYDCGIAKKEVTTMQNELKTSKDCETCLYFNEDSDNQPCCSCVNYSNWELTPCL